jgi:hypothetical protein
MAQSFIYMPLDQKMMFALRKWNVNTNASYPDCFPNKVNAKEGLDVGDSLLSSDIKYLINKRKT